MTTDGLDVVIADDAAEEVAPLRVGQAAEMLGVTVETLRRWELEGRLQLTRSAGGQPLSRGSAEATPGTSGRLKASDGGERVTTWAADVMAISAKSIPFSTSTSDGSEI